MKFIDSLWVTERLLIFIICKFYQDKAKSYLKVAALLMVLLRMDHEVFISEFIPPQPPKSFRITLELNSPERRLDAVLLDAIKKQNKNLTLREISRVKYKELFKDGKVLIKGQRATPSSSLAKGTTYIDILGF
jgi:hypothetical protein